MHVVWGPNISKHQITSVPAIQSASVKYEEPTLANRLCRVGTANATGITNSPPSHHVSARNVQKNSSFRRHAPFFTEKSNITLQAPIPSRRKFAILWATISRVPISQRSFEGRKRTSNTSTNGAVAGAGQLRQQSDGCDGAAHQTMDGLAP